MLYCVDIMKAIACLLIVNFHSDILFPDKLLLLSFGGDIGNNIFFLISGFVLADGIRQSRWIDLDNWLKKRYFRILPQVVVMEILYVAFRGGCSVEDIGYFFIFPTLYWFTGAIVIFYPLLFFVEKCNLRLVKSGLALGLLVLHVIFDSLFAERYFIGFFAMMLGYELRIGLNNNETKFRKISQKSYFTFLIFSGLLYVVLKFLRNQGVEVVGLIHLGIGICTVLLALCLLVILYLSEDKLKKIFEEKKILRWIIKTLSSITLSVYLVQVFADGIIVNVFLRMSFPFSYISELVVVLVLAFVITNLDNYLHEIIKGKK